MKILVYMRDGRTVYLLQKRGELVGLLGHKPGGDHGSLQAVRGIWNPFTGEYVWSHVRLRFIASGSIGVVEEAPHGLADALPPEERDASV